MTKKLIITSFENVAFGKSFRFEQQWCVKVGPFTFHDCGGKLHPIMQFGGIHTAVAANKKDLDF